MIKSARNGNLDILIWKILFFSLWLLFIRLRILLLFPFFRFRVTWPGNRVRRNLPIDFEILILSFEPLYGLLYIKRKHVICRTQKCALDLDFITMFTVTVIFRSEWSKWPFRTKMNQSGHVIHHSKAYELYISKKTFSWQKNRSWELLATKIKFFEKFCDDVIITLSDQNRQKYQRSINSMISVLEKAKLLCLCYP